MPFSEVTDSTIFPANTAADFDVFIPGYGSATGSGASIGGGFFLTAAHVITAGSTSSTPITGSSYTAATPASPARQDA